MHGLRNKQKRQSNIQLPDPYSIENYTSINFALDEKDNKQVAEGSFLIVSSAIALVWFVANDAACIGAADDALIPETIYGIGKGFSMVMG